MGRAAGVAEVVSTGIDQHFWASWFWKFILRVGTIFGFDLCDTGLFLSARVRNIGRSIGKGAFTWVASERRGFGSIGYSLLSTILQIYIRE